MALPTIEKSSYRYDVDWGGGRSCNGTDLFSDDSFEISSSGDRVTFTFNNEADLPAWFDLHFDKKNRLHWIKYPNEPKNRRPVPSTEEHYDFVTDALRCAISLEQDGTKKSALGQVLTLIQSARGVH